MDRRRDETRINKNLLNQVFELEKLLKRTQKSIEELLDRPLTSKDIMNLKKLDILKNEIENQLAVLGFGQDRPERVSPTLKRIQRRRRR